MSFKFRPAVREDAIPVISFYSPSGAGKTLTSLLLARGIVGPSGRIALIDTEYGRGSSFIDDVPGGYDTLKLSEPFSPDRYIEALQCAENSNYDIVIVDSVSHEWEGIGGVLDMASQIQERTGKAGMHCWNKPKMAHNKFVLKLLGSKIPIIICIRGKYKNRQVGKDIVRDEILSPIQSEDFIFEMTLHAEIRPDHSIHITKCSNPDLRLCIDEGKAITIETGERIAKWSKGHKTGKSVVDVLTSAREAANKGEEAFRVWFKGATTDERTHAKTIMSELKTTCKETDNPEEEDPFANDDKQTKLAIGQFTMELSQCLDTESVEKVWDSIPEEYKSALEKTKSDILNKFKESETNE